jgi:6-phosphogluconolactonase
MPSEKHESLSPDELMAGSAPLIGPALLETATPMFAYVGCYTSPERQGHGEGINVYRIDPVAERWTHVQLVKGLFNPSFLAFDRSERFLYSVHGDDEHITAFHIDNKTGTLGMINQQSIGGKNGVHLSIDPSNRFIVTANYSSGTVAVVPRNRDGSLAPLCDLVVLSGTPGPNVIEQAFSHPHHVPFHRNGRFIVVPDKGLDKIFVFRLDIENERLLPNDPPAVSTRPGACPRHIDFHPHKPFAYINNELHSSITAFFFDEDRGELKPVQEVSTIPPEFTGKNKSAEIIVAPSGRFIYCSNRGHDSIVIYGIDEMTGLLTLVGWESARGRTPRFITMNPTGKMLYAANQNSDAISSFLIDPSTGKMVGTGQVMETGSPSCIIFKVK